MTDEMMDPTSFLEEESQGVCDGLGWGHWGGEADQVPSKKRKSPDGELHHLPAGLAKSVSVAQDKTSPPSKVQRRDHCKCCCLLIHFRSADKI